MTSPAGWYDDPEDPKQQRYWDGSTWTDQRRAQQGPPPFQGQFGQAAQHGQVYGAGGPGPTQHGQPVPQPRYGQYAPGYQPPAPGQSQTPGQQPNGQQYGQQYGQQHYGQQQYGQYAGHPQQQGGYGYPGQKVYATPDGQPLSGWWRRVWAHLIDSIIIWIVGLPLTGYFYWQEGKILQGFLTDVFDAAAAGNPQTNTSLPPEVYKWIIPATLLSAAVGFVYEYLFLTKKGATPGKMALGIAVRLRDVPGNPPGQAVAKRYGFEILLSLLSAVPLVGTLFSFLVLLDYLWPLWDDKKQALHDKVAGTNVVRTR